MSDKADFFIAQVRRGPWPQPF